ncbi:Hypothetical protein PBC10988_26900 [Planctomycetales bacterium 10988]|nr:Hypothetical protein PBC10988_26900 [Planctomycetales bacterium 10988]
MFPCFNQYQKRFLILSPLLALGRVWGESFRIMVVGWTKLAKALFLKIPFPVQRAAPCSPRPIPLPRHYRYVRARWHVVMGTIDYGGWFLRSIVQAMPWMPKNQPVSWAKPRSILVIQLDHLGDAVLSLGFLKILQKQFPRARIDVLASQANAELFQLSPVVNQVYCCQSTRFSPKKAKRWWVWDLIGWACSLRKERYHLAIDVRGELPHAFFMWLMGAQRRLGWNCGGGGFLLTDSPTFVPARHEVASRAALLRVLGNREEQLVPACRPRLKPQNVFFTSVAQRLRTLDVLPNQDPSTSPLVVLHIGAGTAAKRWPFSHWRQLVRKLGENPLARVVLIGTQAERRHAALIMGPQYSTRYANWCGECGLGELTALLALADVVIGADSGPVHLAAAVGTPAIVLFSGTNRKKQWQPWGTSVQSLQVMTACSPCHRATCSQADHPCMRALTVSQVWEAIRRVLPEFSKSSLSSSPTLIDSPLNSKAA